MGSYTDSSFYKKYPFENVTFSLGPINSDRSSSVKENSLIFLQETALFQKHPKFAQQLFDFPQSVDRINQQLTWTNRKIKIIDCKLEVLFMRDPNNVVVGVVFVINDKVIDHDKMPKDGPIIIDGDTINGQSLDNFTIAEEI